MVVKMGCEFVDRREIRGVGGILEIYQCRIQCG